MGAKEVDAKSNFAKGFMPPLCGRVAVHSHSSPRVHAYRSSNIRQLCEL